VDSTLLFRECAPPSIGLTRLALLITCRETAWPPLYAVGARKNRAPAKARSIRRASSEPRCAGSDPRTFRTYGFPPVPLCLGCVDRADRRENL